MTVSNDKWHGRAIYFVMTDRFALPTTGGDQRPRCGVGGGTLSGVTRRLDYIQSMGFDAIWITPVVKQLPWRDNWNGTAYHGYWAADFASLEARIGGETELQALKDACASRGMLLMLDVVANHVGPIHSLSEVAQLGPGLRSTAGFTQFHTLDRAPDESFAHYLTHPRTVMSAGERCWPHYDFGRRCNHSVILNGWFGDLADLNQSNSVISSYLLRAIRNLVQTYGIDGLRLDTALYMPNWFLDQLQQVTPGRTTIRAHREGSLQHTHRSMPSLYATLCRSMPLYAALCSSMPVHTNLRRSIPLYATICHSIPLYTTLCHSMPLYTSLYHSTPLYTSLYHSMPRRMPRSLHASGGGRAHTWRGHHLQLQFPPELLPTPRWASKLPNHNAARQRL